MEGQAPPGAGGGEEPLGSRRMNPKRSVRAAEEESRNKPKLVSELWGWEGAGDGLETRRKAGEEEAARMRLVASQVENLGRRGGRPGGCRAFTN